MSNLASVKSPQGKSGRLWNTILVLIGLLAFVALFLWVDNIYYKFSNTWFPNVGTSAWLAFAWGVVQRAHLLIFLVPLAIWRPRLLGFRVGKIWQHRRLLLVMLLANCGVIAAYLWLTGSSTPYSGNQWLVTEVITVPVVEELFWRGLIFIALLQALRKLYPEDISQRITVWLSGLAFGLLHGNNLFAGVPLQFIVIQVINATVWGILYGYARSKTDSLYPSIFLHAAMNLVVILF
jgi:membrane protease YdiL (CAAX protease family)